MRTIGRARDKARAEAMVKTEDMVWAAAGARDGFQDGARGPGRRWSRIIRTRTKQKNKEAVFTHAPSRHTAGGTGLRRAFVVYTAALFYLR